MEQIKEVNSVYTAEFRKQIETLDVYPYYCFFEKEFPEIAKLILEQNFVAEKTIDLIRFAQNEYLLKDKDEPVVVTFGKDNQTVTINPSNFYNAYFTDIWEKLDIKQRARIILWHFEYRMKELNLAPNQEKLLFFPTLSMVKNENLKAVKGSQFGDNLFFNAMKIKSGELLVQNIIALEHEITHIIQREYGKTIVGDRTLPRNIYDFACANDSITDLNVLINPECIKDNKKIQKNLKVFRYLMERRYILEYKAERRGIKCAEEFYALSKKQFGKDEKFEQGLKDRKFQLDFDCYLDDDGKKMLFGRISMNSEYLTKLLFTRQSLVWNANKLSRLTVDEKQASAEQILKWKNKAIDCVKKINLIDETVEKYFENGELQPVPQEVQDIYEQF